MNKTGFQIQRWGSDVDSMLSATYPHLLEFLHTGANLTAARTWRSRRPDGILVLRTVGSNQESLEDWAQLTDVDIGLWKPWLQLGGKIILKVRWNEQYHTSQADFARLARFTLLAARKIKDAGFTPGVLSISEGNPPGPNFGIDFFLQLEVLEALAELRELGAVWCPNGYSHPPAGSTEPYHSLRPMEILRRLPEPYRLNYLLAESGCDGGTDQLNQRREVGWRGYFDSARAYASWCRPKRDALAQDPLCLGESIFLCGGLPPWNKPEGFDIGDEVDLRPLFTELVPGPPITWLGSQTKENTVPRINGFTVGQGVADKLTANGDKPISNERYVGTPDANNEAFFSLTLGQKGLYVYSKDANTTVFLPGR
jgi:hypothetical protein